MEAVITILGSIASILGAIWAMYQAHQSDTSAKRAEELRDEIIDRRQLVEVSQVHTETRRILSVVSEIGPSSSETSASGLDYQNVASQVDEYSRYLIEQSAHFNDFFDNRARELCTGLRPEIEKLAQSVEYATAHEAGVSIYSQIFEFTPVTKNLADMRRER